eukprot:12491115-Alexandrium_andersonii.AAC.1
MCIRDSCKAVANTERGDVDQTSPGRYADRLPRSVFAKGSARWGAEDLARRDWGNRSTWPRLPF